MHSYACKQLILAFLTGLHLWPVPSLLRHWGEVRDDNSFQPSAPFKAIKESPVSRTLWELGRNLRSRCRPKYSNWVSLEATWVFLSVDPAGGGKSGQAPAHPVALELLIRFQQLHVRAPAVVLCLATSSKAVLVQVLLVNLNPCCQRKQTSRCCRGHIVGLPWNPAACQPPLHSKTFGLAERLCSQSFSLHRGVLGHLSSPQLPIESCRYLLWLWRSARLAAARVVIVSEVVGFKLLSKGCSAALTNRALGLVTSFGSSVEWVYDVRL